MIYHSFSITLFFLENAINDGEQNQDHEMELRAHQLNEESLRGMFFQFDNVIFLHRIAYLKLFS